MGSLVAQGISAPCLQKSSPQILGATNVIPIPSRDDTAIDEGIDAYCMGVGRSACPHKPGSQRHRDWLLGWDEAEAIDFEQRYDW